MSEELSIQKLLMGQHLRDRQRYEEATAFFREFIAQDPDDPRGYFELALTQYFMKGEGMSAQALATIDRAIQLEPDDYQNLVLKSVILTRGRRYQDAIEVADQARSMEPDSNTPWRARGQALMGMERWKEAEEALREALELDPDDEISINLLVQSLRLQNRKAEAEQVGGVVLSLDPESPIAHFNAGWSALQRGDHRKAEDHFRESLRLDADFDEAREGLIESFKARSPIYRGHLAWCFWMQKHSAATRWAIILGLIAGVKVGTRLLQQVHPLAAAALAVAYGLFVFYGWLASGIGHFLILLDRKARLALKKKEILDGCFVGGGLTIGLLMLISGILMKMTALTMAGGLLMLSAIPASMTFTNESKAGKWTFGALTAVVVACVPVAVADPAEGGAAAMGAGILIAFACTWIGQIPQLRRNSQEF